ncbi:MAG: hypothetical protein EHM40_02915 [Chloroflexi bacterium]|nr:MAG: hypothetical protein EHM40_02915 [Chloroflexota bacterium]
MNTIIAEQPKIVERFAMQVKRKPKETAAIEQLGQMNERHTRALVAGDREALLELAGEYMLLGTHGGCPRLAADIMKEAESLEPAREIKRVLVKS